MDTIPFGKHKGKALAELETGYLYWLLGRELREPLRGRVAAELERRAPAAPAPSSPLTTPTIASPPRRHICPACGVAIAVVVRAADER